jgi:hypothetical protein
LFTTSSEASTTSLQPSINFAESNAFIISCQNNPGVRNGVLTVSEDFTNPTFGPLVSILARASGLLLLSIGLTGLAGTLLRKRFPLLASHL